MSMKIVVNFITFVHEKKGQLADMIPQLLAINYKTSFEIRRDLYKSWDQNFSLKGGLHCDSCYWW